MKKILCLLLCLGTLTACSAKALAKHTSTATDIGFDTFVSFIAYTENEAKFNAYDAFLQSEFKRYDKLFDKYTAYEDIANIKTINDQAGKQAVKVDKAIIELLTLSKTYDTFSNHQFDITMGSVLNIWHDYREAGSIANKENKTASIPSIDILQNAKKSAGWDNVVINEEESSVYIKNKDTSLDVGGVAKGFAVEKIAQALEAKGLQHAIINAGGNVRLIGDKPQDTNWTVGVQIPDIKGMETDSLLSLKFDDSISFVTSGDYQRYYLYNEEIMHHIIDPQTLFPARHSRSVTVITKDSGIADILSTTLYTLSFEEGNALLQKLKTEKGIEANAIWVYDDTIQPEKGTNPMSVKGYQIVVSDGLKNKIETQ